MRPGGHHKTTGMLIEIPLILTILIITHSFAAWVWVDLLTEPGMILGHLHAWAIRKLPWWIHKPFISCEKCVAGQLSFWGFIWWSWKLNWEYDPFLHFYMVTISILITYWITRLIAHKPEPINKQGASQWAPPEIKNNE